MERLLKLRKEMKRRKPHFMRQCCGTLSLEPKWRQPKGMQSKLRRKWKGHGRHPSMGYSSPKEVRGLNSKGLRDVLVNNVAELLKLKPGEAAAIRAGVGKKKRVEILKKAAELNITVSNVKDAAAFIASVEDKLKERKESAAGREEKKKASKEEALKKAEKKEEKKAEETPEEKEKKEKEEQRKVLEKRD